MAHTPQPQRQEDHPEPGTVRFEQKGDEGERLEDAPTAEELSQGLWYFGNRLCPFAHRAWLAMHEKGVADKFRYIHVDLGVDKPGWFKQVVNPEFGTVPCVYDAGRPVFESAIVIEYLEDKFSNTGTPLLPADAAARAAVRLFVARLDFKPLYDFLLDTERSRDGEHAAKCVCALEALEARFAAGRAAMPSGGARNDGPFFLGGAAPSAADVAVLPFLDRLAPGLQAYRGFHLWQAARLPRLGQAWCAMQARPAWRATAQPPAFYVSAYEGYAAGKCGVPHRVRAASPDAAAYAAVPPCPPP